MVAGAGGVSAAGAGGAAGAEDMGDDPVGDLFPPVPASCEGLLCIEDADCGTLYVEQAATCKLTKCVDFTCQ
jgi:hypothetical protein